MNRELSELNVVLGKELLSSLLNTTPEKLNHYIKNQHQVPSVVEDKMQLIGAIVWHLKGSYNHRGIRDWFQRKRVQLHGKRPTDILEKDWWPRDSEVLGVLMLSADTKS